MTCTSCSSTLPPGALFCGECGRRVAPAASAATAAGAAPGGSPEIIAPAPGNDLPSPPLAPELEGPPALLAVGRPSARILAAPSPVEDERESPEPVEVPALSEPSPTITPTRDPVCEQCGTVMAPGDIFCGECGFVARSVTDAFSGSIPTAQVRARAPRPAPVSAPAPAAPPPADATPFPLRAPQAPPAPITRDSSARDTDAPTPSRATPAAAASIDDDDDIEETRIVRRPGAERFVLQFSTGESVSVYGTGLIGRNPRQEPGEFFDQLVRVLDGGRSVSKTHLEFGQEDGAFWLKDRHSGNGTVVREPDAPPRRCEPDKRYRVVRGSRVEIGEQFFVVS